MATRQKNNSSFNAGLVENRQASIDPQAPQFQPVQSGVPQGIQQGYRQQAQYMNQQPIQPIDSPVVDAGIMQGQYGQYVPTPSYSDASSYAALQATAGDFANMYQAQLGKAQGKGSFYENEIRGIYDRLNGKYASEDELRKQYRIEEQNKEINRLAGRVRNTGNALAKYDLDSGELVAGLENQSIPQGIIGGQQARLSRDRRLERNSLAYSQAQDIAQGQFLQGNVSQALDTIDTAIRLKYGPEEDRLNQVKEYLERNDKEVTRLDSKQEEALKNQLDIGLADIRQKKEEEMAAANRAFQAQENAKSRNFQREQASAKGLSDAEQKKADAKIELNGLLNQYRAALKGQNIFTAQLPGNKATLNSLKGQITAVYKTANQLGTLDAGVQKLIDSIIPDPSNLNTTSLSNSAQVNALDNFIKNQGGTIASSTTILPEEEEEINNILGIGSTTPGFNPVDYYNQP